MIIMKKNLILFIAIFLIKNTNGMACSEQFKVFFIENKRAESVCLELQAANYDKISKFIYADDSADLRTTNDQCSKRLNPGKSAFILLLSEYAEQLNARFPLRLSIYTPSKDDELTCLIFNEYDRKTLNITTKYQDDFGVVPIVSIHQDGKEKVCAFKKYIIKGYHVKYDEKKDKFVPIN
jgi:hypothetical protein